MMLLTVCPKNGKKFLSGPWTKACSRALESEELFLAPSLQFVLREGGGGAVNCTRLCMGTTGSAGDL